jgi:hypothetical protein
MSSTTLTPPAEFMVNRFYMSNEFQADEGSICLQDLLLFVFLPICVCVLVSTLQASSRAERGGDMGGPQQH